MTSPGPIDRGRLRKLLLRMIDIYSPSGKEEELLEYLAGYFKRRGVPVLRQRVDDNRFNLVAAPEEEGIELVLVGHLDTVPAYELDDYGPEEDEGLVWGLGAADMKGGCAAMIMAYLAWRETASEAEAGRAALALVVGEEEEGDGAAQLVNDYEFPWAVIGEPTDLTPCPSHYSYLEVQLTARGPRRHASVARRGHNPVEAMLQMVLALTRSLESTHPELIYNIRDLWSAQAGFAVPDQCEAWLDLHLPPAAPVGKIMAELEEIVGRENAKHPRVSAGVRFATVDAGFELPEKGPVLESLKKIYERRGRDWSPAPFKSHSDAGRLWEAGVRPVILGPGRLEKAHSPEESVPFEQVAEAAEIYYELLRAVASGQ